MSLRLYGISGFTGAYLLPITELYALIMHYFLLINYTQIK